MGIIPGIGRIICEKAYIPEPPLREMLQGQHPRRRVIRKNRWQKMIIEMGCPP